MQEWHKSPSGAVSCSGETRNFGSRSASGAQTGFFVPRADHDVVATSQSVYARPTLHLFRLFHRRSKRSPLSSRCRPNDSFGFSGPRECVSFLHFNARTFVYVQSCDVNGQTSKKTPPRKSIATTSRRKFEIRRDGKDNKKGEKVSSGTSLSSKQQHFCTFTTAQQQQR